MNKYLNFLKSISGLLIIITIAILFPNIFLYFTIALVLFLICSPLTELLKKVKIGKFHINATISAILTIIVLLSAVFLIIRFAVPVFNKEINLVKSIDIQEFINYFNKPIDKIYAYLASFNLVKSREETLTFLKDEIYNIINWTNFKTILGSVVSTTSSIFIGLFSTIFLTFFFLREPYIIKMIFLAIVPDSFENKTIKVLSSTKELLSHYVIGLMVEVLCMMTLITSGLLIFDIPNALMIGVLAGLLNIVPYLGPLMGCVLGTLFGAIAVLSNGSYDTLVYCIIVIPSVFVVANLFDNFLFQPLIYSKSAKAHPVEIFIVILMAGNIGGILGMIIAIPTYTVIRIIAKNFFGNLKFVEFLTRRMDDIKKEG